MNILHLSTCDSGGAGSAAYRLHLNLKSAGYNSKMLVGSKSISDNDITVMPYYLTLWNFYQKIYYATIGKRLLDYKYFYVNRNLPLITTSRLINSFPFVPDFIIVHWVSNFITPRIMYELNHYLNVPIIWNLLDMGPLTGGCHYAFDCLGYTKHCGNCPEIDSNKKIDPSFKQWKNKYFYMQKTDITLVSPTTWLTNQAQQSSIFAGKRVEQIMLGIDISTFKPFPHETVRSVLDIPVNSKVILFGANSLEEKRKGISYLIDALKILENLTKTNPDLHNNIFVLIAGNIQYAKELDIPFPNKVLGYIQNERMLALTYQASDLYVCPSIEDSGPMMINESILCGTPVVSFEMGVALDLVVNHETGYKAKIKDAYDLAYGMHLILNLSTIESKRMSDKCRHLGLTKCHPDVIANKYTNLFKSLKQNCTISNS